ncbi:MAG: carbonic anhydrase, partial [Ktedonobacterales bacterium]
MATGIFGTAINCIDGRAQGPVADWVKVNGNV